MNGQIFISYRREDDPGSTGRIHDRLKNHVEQYEIFMDIDGILAGENFVEKIERKVSECDILIAVIGPRWLRLATLRQPVLNNKPDYVRTEIKTALKYTGNPRVAGRNQNTASG